MQRQNRDKIKIYNFLYYEQKKERIDKKNNNKRRDPLMFSNPFNLFDD
tara:strand:+ start:250 stop:393 length:144 start_codon:yes stop_codon:yes gene_type:complete